MTANLRSSRSLLTELGRFLSREPPELLAFTLSSSLPSLVATCSRDEIVIIANLLQKQMAGMLVEQSTEILKTIFLLPEDHDAEAALDFLVQLIAEAARAKGSSLGTQALVNSCISSLLAELVVVFGDESGKAVLVSGLPHVILSLFLKLILQRRLKH